MSQTPYSSHGLGEGYPQLRLPGGVPADVVPCGNRTAHHHIYQPLPQGKANGAAHAYHPRRQWAQRVGRQPRPLGDTEVHPLWVVHEHLSGLPAQRWLLLHLFHSWTGRYQPRYVARQAEAQRQCVGLHPVPQLPDGMSCESRPR